ncbi:hypothetical protein LINGRAHAP2_LOCUS6747 [Linum grandiflorum]
MMCTRRWIIENMQRAKNPKLHSNLIC